MSAKPKIYVFVNGRMGRDVISAALAEDGTCLAGHMSSSIGFVEHDMGITSDWKHDAYAAHYPGGYELEWVDDPSSHAGFKEAHRRYQALATGGGAAAKEVERPEHHETRGATESSVNG